MAVSRLSIGSDATWARAWVCDTTAERLALQSTFGSPFGPKRGDMILDNEIGQLFLVTNGNSAAQITGLAVLPIDLANDVTGVLPVPNGGIGLSSVAQGDLLYGSATDVLSQLSKNTTATRYLSNTGTSNNPAWAQVDLANGVTGVLPTANGGTSVDIASAALPLGSGQIDFPATQNPSANVNCLDDYDEADFTPVLTFGGGSTGITYSVQLAAVTKIGRFVSVCGLVALTNKGSSTGQAKISLPYSIPNSNRYNCSNKVSYSGFAVGVTDIGLQGVLNEANVFVCKDVTGTNTVCTDADFTNSSALIVYFSFFTS